MYIIEVRKQQYLIHIKKHIRAGSDVLLNILLKIIEGPILSIVTLMAFV